MYSNTCNIINGWTREIEQRATMKNVVVNVTALCCRC